MTGVSELNPPHLFFRKENTVADDFHIRGVLRGAYGGERYLNETAAMAVEYLISGLSVEDTVKRLGDEYDAPLSVIERDVAGLVDQLRMETGFQLSGMHVRVVDVHPPEDPLEWFLLAPIDVFMEITYRCNLRCIHCYASASHAGSEEMSTGEILDVLREASRLGVFRVAIGGGEPLLRDDFIDIVKGAVAEGLWVDFSTNGFYLSEEVLDELSRVGVRWLQVSLDGSCEHVHDAVRGEGSFKRALEAIVLSKEKGFTVAVRTTVSRVNLRDLGNILRLLGGIGVDAWSVARLLPAGRALGNRWLIVDENDIRREVEGLRPEGKPRIVGLSRPVRAVVGSGNTKFMCPAGFSSLTITPTGLVKPCSFFPDAFNAGSLRRKSLEETWYEGEIFKDLRKLRRFNMSEPCRSCRLDCDGGCRAAALTVYGRIDAPDPLCPRVGWLSRG